MAEALSIFHGLGSLAEEVVQTLALARIALACGKPASAACYLAEALGTSRRLGHRSIVRCLDVMVGLAAKVAVCEKAMLFRGACEKLREITGVLATPAEAEEAERHCAACRASLGEAAFAAGVAAGRALSTESIIVAGLEWLGSIASAEPAQAGDRVVRAGE